MVAMRQQCASLQEERNAFEAKEEAANAVVADLKKDVARCVLADFFRSRDPRRLTCAHGCTLAMRSLFAS